MNVLITGGSGFLGINLIRHLLAKDIGTITVLDIAGFDYADVRDRVCFVQGDIRHAAAVASCMDGIDVVVHAAAALPLYSPEDIRSTDIDGTRVLLEEAFRRGVYRFIHI
jgi:nucleoside-diphosphate-sugar epimerase